MMPSGYDDETLQVIRAIKNNDSKGKRSKFPQVTGGGAPTRPRRCFYTLDGELVESYSVEIQSDSYQKKMRNGLRPKFTYNESLQEHILEDYSFIYASDEASCSEQGNTRVANGAKIITNKRNVADTRKENIEEKVQSNQQSKFSFSCLADTRHPWTISSKSTHTKCARPNDVVEFIAEDGEESHISLSSNTYWTQRTELSTPERKLPIMCTRLENVLYEEHFGTFDDDMASLTLASSESSRSYEKSRTSSQRRFYKSIQL